MEMDIKFKYPISCLKALTFRTNGNTESYDYTNKFYFGNVEIRFEYVAYRISFVYLKMTPFQKIREIENQWDVGSKSLNLFPIDILQFTIMASLGAILFGYEIRQYCITPTQQINDKINFQTKQQYTSP